MNVLNLNKKIEERKIKAFKETATKAAKEIDVILDKYDIKIVPFIRPIGLDEGSPLIASLNAGFTFAPLSKIEKETKELMKKKANEKKNTKDSN